MMHIPSIGEMIPILGYKNSISVPGASSRVLAEIVQCGSKLFDIDRGVLAGAQRSAVADTDYGNTGSDILYAADEVSLACNGYDGPRSRFLNDFACDISTGSRLKHNVREFLADLLNALL